MWTEKICERSPHFPAPGAGKQTPVFRVSGGSRCFVSSFFLSHPTCSWSCRGAATGGDGQSLKCEYEGGTSLWQEELYSLKSLGWIPITFFPLSVLPALGMRLRHSCWKDMTKQGNQSPSLLAEGPWGSPELESIEEMTEGKELKKAIIKYCMDTWAHFLGCACVDLTLSSIQNT